MFMTVLSSSVLILLLLCLRPFMKKRFSPVIQYALWGLVVLRLLNPFQLLQSPLSLENLTRREPTPIVEVQDRIPFSDSQTVGNSSIGQNYVPNVGLVPQGTPVVEPSRPSSIVPDTESTVQMTSPHRPSLTTEQILNSIWLVGCVAMALWFLGVNISFARKAKQEARQVQIPGAILPVYESEHIPSPCLLGLIKPRIYILPCEDPIAQKHILAHEETHYRHWDHIWSLVRSLCLCIYWFNPLVWVAAYLSKEDCEAACDHGAITSLGEDERIPYGKTLLHTLAQVNRPGNLLRSATTMAGGKAQIKSRLERIVSKPKKALWAVLTLVLVLCIFVGCTFTGATDPESTEQDAEPQTTTEDQTTLPSEVLPVVDDDTATEPEETTPGEELHGIQVKDYRMEETIRIPQFVSDSNYCETANREILELFDIEADYESIDYSVSRSTWFDDLYNEDVEVLSLLITVQPVQGETLYAAYNVNTETGDPVYLDNLAYKRKAEIFAWELLDRYRDTGSLSYTDETHAILLRNFNHTMGPGDLTQKTVHWITEEGELAASFIYYPLDGGEPYRYTTIYHDGPTEDISINAFVEPQVVELYAYEVPDAEGEVNHVPFLLMDSPRGIEINGKLLRYYSQNVRGTTFSWSTHGDILSLWVTADELYGPNEVNDAYNLSTRTYGDASVSDVLAMANMTEEEYAAMAGPMFEDQFFHLFPTDTLGGLTVPDSILSKSGTPENVADSIPYLAADGSLWALARIYHMAGSEFCWYHVPISNHQFTDEYLNRPQS